ncbi:MAG: HlyD family efflux transporter periplasmic adaptor subunit [Candidatus Eisenbacteria bacterium]|nr:HlyD family efflux transporter periplasmic adaptor subunit [Candidatus Eisenbacteria bacterium]
MNRITNRGACGLFAVLLLLLGATCTSEEGAHRHGSSGAEERHTHLHEGGDDPVHAAPTHAAESHAHDPLDRDHAQAAEEHLHPGEAHAHAAEEHAHADAAHAHMEREHDHPDEARAHRDAERLLLEPSAARSLGIQTELARPGLHYDQVKIPGMIVVDPDRRIEVTAPATVRIAALDARVPAAVRPGERLALLELADREIRDLQMEAIAVRAQQLADRTEQERLMRYLASLRAAEARAEAEIERVAADLRVVEARLAAQRSRLGAQLAALRTAGLGETQLEALAERGAVTTQITLHVPEVAGGGSLEVVDRPVHLGQTVAAGTTLFRLVGLERLWVTGEAFEADLSIVRRAASERLPVRLLFPAEGREVGDLRIAALEGEADGPNRVTHFFIELPNELLGERVDGRHRYQDWAFRAGARVQVLVPTRQVGVRYVVPSTALVRTSGQAWVFVEEDDAYLRLPVPVESVGAREAVLPLDCGLHPGDRLVVRGALQLNLALEQQRGPQAVDPHAGHSH